MAQQTKTEKVGRVQALAAQVSAADEAGDPSLNAVWERLEAEVGERAKETMEQAFRWTLREGSVAKAKALATVAQELFSRRYRREGCRNSSSALRQTMRWEGKVAAIEALAEADML